MHLRGRPCKVLSVYLVLLLAGCGVSRQPKEQVLGIAYVGPAVLRLRRDLTSKVPDGDTLRHGERVEIIGRRRIFVKVRTASGIRGWTQLRSLLSEQQMQELSRLAERAAAMPSHGAATVYEPLNVHTEPNRQAPTFHQIQPGEHVQLVARRLAPRVPYQNPTLLRQDRTTESRPAFSRNPDKHQGPPPPPAPKPPANWLELSRTPPEVLAARAARQAKSPAVDTWALVRLNNGRAGWVLARMLRMEIPDEVAQYSEGHAITSYFSVGQVRDGDQIKHNWLWTTLAPGDHPYDFDSFRYFVWNPRRHRYETAYIERNLKGYFPVSIHPVEVNLGRKQQVWPGFSVIVEEAGGVRYRKTYAYQVYLVRLIAKTPLSPAAQPPTP